MILGFAPGEIGTAVSVTLPWLIVPAAALAVPFLVRRRRRWLPIALVAGWLLCVAPAFTVLPPSSAPEADSIVFAAQNVEARSGSAAESADELVRRGADVIALTELDADSRAEAEERLGPTHPYSYGVGTVGLWSTMPIDDAQPLDLGLGWYRALAADVETPAGPVSVYVVHAASVRPGAQSERDVMLSELAELISGDDSDRIVALGDFNASSTDPALAGIRSRLVEPAGSSPGFGFTWPAAFPLVRIDHVYERGFADRGAETLRAGASDHLAVLARLAP